MPPANQSCANCLYFVRQPERDECRRRAPIAGMPFPEISPRNWCGEWAPLPVPGQSRDLGAEVVQLRLERDEARKIAEGLAQRVAAQADLLARQAAKEGEYGG